MNTKLGFISSKRVYWNKNLSIPLVSNRHVV